MGNDRIDLALAFLQSQPGSAAKLLEQQPVEDVAAFVAKVPHTHSALVLERFLPQYTAKLCERLDPEVCAGFLSRMHFSSVAAVLRYSKPDTKKRIKELLPEKTRFACRILLNYSEDAVGAWMVPNVFSLPSDYSVAEALSRISSDETLVDLDAVFVVDRDGTLQGSVNGKALLTAKSDSPIVAIMTKGPRSLYGRATLASAKNHVGWRTRDSMPVVSSSNQLVGVIRHVDLRNGIEQLAKPAQGIEDGGLFWRVVRAYCDCFVALANVLGGTGKR